MSLIHCLSILCISAASSGVEVQFADRPKVARQGEQVTITFTLSQAADVEVAVLDAEGRIVRHLAAEVLGGEKLSPPPLEPGLKQSLVWDGHDDLHRPAGGGPFRVRLRAGTRVKFDRQGNYVKTILPYPP